MKVTVRTLDSKSTTFEVDEEATVKDFKEKIAPEVGIPADRQRVIFKGKVLHDDKLMKEYNVDGCVVHLVQRPPPASTATSSAESRPTNSANRRPQNGGQSNVFIGAFQGGGDEMSNVTQQIVESLMSSFGGGHGAATVSTTSMGDATAVNVQINMHADGQHAHSSDAQVRLRQAHNFIRSAENRVDALEASTSPNVGMNQEQASQHGTSNGSGNSGNQFDLTNSPQSFSRVIRNFQNLYGRLEPSLTRYRDLLDNPKSEARRPADDNLPDGIAEALHNMSHALHALSDVTFNFQSPDPQRVNCLPRMTPVSVPPHSHVRSSNSNPQNESTQTPPPSSAAGSNGQPFVPVAPQASNSSASAPGQPLGPSGLLNSGAQSQQARAPGNPQIGRPIGVSATVIQIPTQLRTVRTAAMQQQANVSRSTTITTPNVTTPPQRTSTGTTFSTGTFTPGSFPSMNFSNMLNPSAGQTTSTSSTQTRPGPTQQGPGPHLPRLPFSLDALNPTSLVGHPDPSVPCQSFHFGTRFQQGSDGSVPSRPHIVAEVSSVVIEHIHNGIPSSASSTSEPTTVSGSATGPSANQMRGHGVQNQMSNILGGMFGSPQHLNQGPPGVSSVHTSQHSQGHAQGQPPAPNLGADFGPRIYQEVQRAMMRAITGQGGQGSPTVRSLVDEGFAGVLSSDDSESTDFMSKLLDFMADHMTVDDIFELFVGASLRPLRRLAPHVKSFIEKEFNNGERLSNHNVARVVEEITRNSQGPTTEVIDTLNVRPDIDLEATMNRFDREMFTEALFKLVDHENDRFPDDTAALFYRYVAMFVAIVDYCVEGKAEAYTRAVLASEKMSRRLSSLDPSMRSMFVELTVSKLRGAAANGPSITDAEVQSKLVKKVKENDGASFSNSVSSTCASGPKEEKIDLDKKWKELYGNGCNDSSDDDSCPAPTEFQEWHRHVPPEWIAVITKDAKRQRSQTPQRPFSDAYHSGLPAKRRKAVSSEEESKIDFRTAVRNSIKSAKVEPKTSNADLSKDLEKEELERSFQGTIRKDARKRLERDPDYKPGRFPNSDEYFFPEK